MRYVHNQWYDISCATLYIKKLFRQYNMIRLIGHLLGCHLTKRDDIQGNYVP